VIYDSSSNSLHFCLHSKQYDFEEEEKYYKLTNINPKNVIFPIVEKGHDYILLKIDKYSVSQYIAATLGRFIYFNIIII